MSKHNLMLEYLSCALAGALIGFGFTLAQMTDPGKVVGFLAVGPAWNPALMGVLGGAVAVSLLGFFVCQRMTRPWIGREFFKPGKTRPDRQMIIGSVLFGIGWGAAGYCPGPAIASIALGNPEGIEFLAFMILGGLAQPWLAAKMAKPPKA